MLSNSLLVRIGNFTVKKKKEYDWMFLAFSITSQTLQRRLRTPLVVLPRTPYFKIHCACQLHSVCYSTVSFISFLNQTPKDAWDSSLWASGLSINLIDADNSYGKSYGQLNSSYHRFNISSVLKTSFPFCNCGYQLEDRGPEYSALQGRQGFIFHILWIWFYLVSTATEFYWLVVFHNVLEKCRNFVRFT